MSRNAGDRALHGRRAEREELDRLLAEAASGRSRVLVLRGEPGVGKTALLDDLGRHADGVVVSRVTGVESEVELSYAMLQQLCAPFMTGAASLPEPQRQALAAAFGAVSGEPADRFLVGLGMLGLLADAAESTPLLCIIDDAQWVDSASAQALTFVARRVAAERIMIVVALRDADPALDGRDPFDALPTRRIEGLTEEDAATLLDSVVAGHFDPRVRNRILAEARGNPLALIELPREFDSRDFAFGVVAVERGSLSGRLESGFARRLAALPANTRELLLIAAAEPMGDVTLLWRAAELRGIRVDAVEPAQEAGLIELGAQVRFRHPLTRSAVYRGATEPERRAAHRLLAEAMIGGPNADCLIWHRGEAVGGVDETIAAELEAAAVRAQLNGGWTAAAAFLSRSMELTPDAGLRARRALAVSDAQLQAGSIQAAHAALTIAEIGALDERDEARAQLLEARISFAATRGRDAPRLLLRAAKRWEELDADQARETYLDAFIAALFAGRLADGGSALTDVAHAIRQAQWTEASTRLPAGCVLLLDGLATLVERGYDDGVPLIRDALNALDDDLADDVALRWLWPAARAARAVGDDAHWLGFTDRLVELARRAGALTVLPIALTERCTAELFTGDLAAALALAAEAEAVTTATGDELSPLIAFLLAAWRGNENEARTLLDARTADVSRRGEGLWLMGTELISAVFLNGFGRYEEALEAAKHAAEHPFELGLSTWVYPEVIEAAVRSDHTEQAAPAMESLSTIAVASGTDWSLGVLARCRALLSNGADADAAYQESIERLERTRIRMALSRSRLVYGEWLRREGRRVDARAQLRPALEYFLTADMQGFAERARRELAATGETVRARSVDATNDLTPQETLIARMVADGRTNPEIGAQLFLSPRTVEWHLGKVFTKLGVASRRDLRASMASTPGLGRGVRSTGV